MNLTLDFDEVSVLRKNMTYLLSTLEVGASIVIRAHSFLQQILTNSAGQFAEFCSSPRQNCLNSAAYRGRSFVNKLSSILCINFSC